MLYNILLWIRKLREVLRFNWSIILIVQNITTVYLSEEERKKIPAHILQKDEDVIIANKENMELIKSLGWR